MTQALLEIKDLKVSTAGDGNTTAPKMILNGVNLTLKPGEVHAIMGPNGSGKSTLSHILAGNPDFQLTSGTILFAGKDLMAMSVEERARAGMFIAFQYPPEIPGVNNMQFLRTAVNTTRKHRDQNEISAGDFLAQAKTIMARLGMKPEMIKRSLNEGFSGGEKKKNELLQMAMLEPQVMVLDEIDSGLDVDALELVAQEAVHTLNTNRAMIVITHYSRILKFIKPDHVHILSGGQIIESGGIEVAERIEKLGYA